MSEKKEKITNGQNIEIDDITVINEGISLSEVEKEEEQQVVAPETEEVSKDEVSSEVPAVEVDLPTPDVKVDSDEVAPAQEEVKVEVPEEPVVPIDLPSPGVDMPDVNASLEMPDDNPISALAANMEFSPNQDFSNPSMYSETASNPVDSSFDAYQNQENNNQDYNATSFASTENYNPTSSNNTLDNTDSGVFKTANDVDAAFERFISDVRKSYQENIAGPTKTLVEFANRFENWGNQVTAKGLNRGLFDEYDELIALLNSKKSYGETEKTIENAVYNDNNTSFNNFGDDQINNGGMFLN